MSGPAPGTAGSRRREAKGGAARAGQPKGNLLSVDASNAATDLIVESVFELIVHHLKKIRATLDLHLHRRTIVAKRCVVAFMDDHYPLRTVFFS